MTASYLLAALFFGYTLNMVLRLYFLLSVLLSIFAFISFGLVIAPSFIMYRGIQQWQNAMEFPVIFWRFPFPDRAAAGLDDTHQLPAAALLGCTCMHETSQGPGIFNTYCWHGA